MVKIYLARKMSKRDKKEVVLEAKYDKEFFEKCGFKVLCPVFEEGVKEEKKTLQATYEEMARFWKRDKEMIRNAHIVLDMTPHLKSEGTTHELGYARYHLWKKVIRVFPEYDLPNPASVAYFEDDYITDSRIDAVREILKTHGTLWRRLKWRWNIYKRCWFKAILFRLREWK